MENGAGSGVAYLNHEYIRLFPGEAAQAAAGMGKNEIAELLNSAPVAESLALWERLPLDIAADTAGLLGRARVRELFTRGDATRSARLLARMKEEDRHQAIAQLDPGKARELAELMSYPDDTAGALMDTRFAGLEESMTAEEALRRIRKQKPRFARYLFLVTAQGRLDGMVEIQDLALAPPKSHLGEIKKAALAGVLPVTRREEIVQKLETIKTPEMPVVDADGLLVGIIRYDALIDALRTETSADILSMAGVNKDERALSGVGFVVSKRLPWLQINLLTAFLAASVVGLFESMIAQFTALAVLLPVVAGQSGNTGAQALAVTMRGLALHEIGTSHWRRVARKEAAAGLINGVAVAAVTALAVYLWSGSRGLSLIIGVSMVVSMVAAGVAGVIIPSALSAFRQDPAQSASIILTTVTDVTGFFTFLGIASLLVSLL